MENLLSKKSIAITGISFLISSIVLFGIFSVSKKNIPQEIPPTATKVPIPTITPTCTPEMIDFEALLREAQENLEANPEKVFDILEPNLDKIPNTIALGEAYILLGLALQTRIDFAEHYEDNKYFKKAVDIFLEIKNGIDSESDAYIAFSYLSVLQLYNGDTSGALDSTKNYIKNHLSGIEDVVDGRGIIKIIKNLDLVIQEAYSYDYGLFYDPDDDFYDQYIENITEILPPLLDGDIPDEDLFFVYKLLGNAFAYSNQLLLSANFFLKAYKLEEDFESLANAAYMFYLAGDHACTYKYYNVLLLSDYESDIPKSSLEELLENIEDLYDGEVPNCMK